MTRRRVSLGLLGLGTLVAGCGRQERPAAADPVAARAAGPPARVAVTEGFSTPESVLWDAEQGVWFVSNIGGNPTVKDNNGFISRLRRDGSVDSLHFVAGGKSGVTLNAPKGMVLQGDTLWVADIDAVRGFDRRSGAAVATVEFGSRARFLNDIAIGPDGTLYITDTGVGLGADGQLTHTGPDRVFALKGRTVLIAAEGAWLSGPNGITWDPHTRRFVIVPFFGTALVGWAPGAEKVDTLGTGPGSQDGVELLGTEPLVTSWADSSLFAATASGPIRLVGSVNSPADIGVDPVRRWVGIPLFLENRVEFWQVPAR
jgi:hypothetical protein